MSAILLISLVFIVFGSVTLLMSRTKKNWKTALTHLGFSVFAEEAGVSARGTYGGFNVRVDVAKQRAVVTVELKEFPKAFQMAPVVDDSLSLKRRFVTGAAPFDDVFTLHGDEEPHVLSVVDKEVRQLALGLSSLALKVEMGNATCAQVPIKSILKTVESLVRLATFLGRDESGVAERLADNSHSEERATVRLRNLFLLQKAYSKNALACSASERALGDRDLGVRFLGAIYLGKTVPFDLDWEGPLSFRGSSIVDALRFVSEKGYPIDKNRAGALLADLLKKVATHTLSLRRGTVPPKLPTIEKIFSSPGQEKFLEKIGFILTLLGELDRLAPMSLIGSIEDLVRLKTVEIDRAVIALMERKGGSVQKEAVIKLLSSPDLGVQVSAAQIVGKIGGRESVLPLILMKRRARLWSDVRSEATKALEQIRTRLGSVGDGTLALSEGMNVEGAVSFSQQGEIGLSKTRGDEKETTDNL